MYASAVNSTHKSAQIKKHIVLCCNNYGFYANNIHRQAHTHIHKGEYKCKIENPPSVFVVVFFFIVFFLFRRRRFNCKQECTSQFVYHHQTRIISIESRLEQKRYTNRKTDIYIYFEIFTNRPSYCTVLWLPKKFSQLWRGFQVKESFFFLQKIGEQ